MAAERTIPPPPPPPSAKTRAKRAKLEAILQGYGSLLVAYSGGVDSTFLAAEAGRLLGEKALAVTARSESLAPEELDEAVRHAHAFGFRHRIVRTEELSDPRYAANPLERCYFCKAELMDKLRAVAAEEDLAKIALGAIVDDLGEARPGETASLQQGAVFPLREAGLAKAEIRSLSRELGLPTAAKPGGACLASRIPFGQAVSAEKLRQIAQAEALLHRAGFRACRLRHHGEIARIEVPVEQFADLLAAREALSDAIQKLGFVYVTLDLQGLRSGSLHEAVRNNARPKT